MSRQRGSFVRVVLVGMAISGCVSSLNQSKPYRDYYGKPLMLEENSRLIRNDGWSGGTLSMLLSGPHQLNELFGNSDPLLQDSSYGLWNYTPLPVGTPLRLTKFLYRVTGGSAYIEAHGEIYVEEKDRYVPFIYNWAERCDRFLRRAPWEPADIQAEQRPLRRSGCPE